MEYNFKTKKKVNLFEYFEHALINSIDHHVLLFTLLLFLKIDEEKMYFACLKRVNEFVAEFGVTT